MTPFVTPGRRASRGIVELTVQASTPARTSSATSADAATVRGVVRGASRWYSDHTSRSEEHTSELQSLAYLVCRLLLEKKKNYNSVITHYFANYYDLARTACTKLHPHY